MNGLSLCNSELLASCADDGSLRLWSVHDREQALQFQVKEQVCLISGQDKQKFELKVVNISLPISFFLFV